jgi:hypothetical protein
MMKGSVSEEKPRATSAPAHTSPPENPSGLVPGQPHAGTSWGPHMRRAPFSDHEDADIARWSI